MELLTLEDGKLGPMLTKTKSWVELQVLGPGWLCPGQLVRWAGPDCGAATEHLVQIKAFPSQDRNAAEWDLGPGLAGLTLP